jgi:hypothetical protein
MNPKEATQTALTILRGNIEDTKKEILATDLLVKKYTEELSEKNAALSSMLGYEKHLSKSIGEEPPVDTPISIVTPPIVCRERTRPMPPTTNSSPESILKNAISAIQGDFMIKDLYELNCGLTPTQAYKAFQTIKGEYDEIITASGRRAAVYRKKA